MKNQDSGQLEFTSGDSVQLRSGGPVMTVKQLMPPGGYMGNHYRCQWFSGATLKDGYFLPNTLKKHKQIPDLDI